MMTNLVHRLLERYQYLLAARIDVVAFDRIAYSLDQATFAPGVEPRNRGFVDRPGLDQVTHFVIQRNVAQYLDFGQVLVE